jgi:hypothetical protein
MPAGHKQKDAVRMKKRSCPLVRTNAGTQLGPYDVGAMRLDSRMRGNERKKA